MSAPPAAGEKDSMDKSESELIDFSDESSCTFHDCKIKLDSGEELYASKAVLALSSQILHDAITECEENETIALPMKTKEDVLIFLNLIYPRASVSLKADMLPNQLAIADELEASKLKAKCEEFIVNNVGFGDGPDAPSIGVEDALQWYFDFHCSESVKEKCAEKLLEDTSRLDIGVALLAQKFELDSVMDMCVEELARNFDVVRHDPRLGGLDAVTVQQIASKGYERLKLRLKSFQSRMYSNRRGPTSAAFYAMQLAARRVCEDDDTFSPGSTSDILTSDSEFLDYTTVGADARYPNWIRRTGSSYV